MANLRLNKFLSQMGVASRRGAELLIAQGRVMVGGEKVTAPGRIIDPERERVWVDGREVEGGPKPTYLILNKPKGFLVTSSDRFGRPTIFDLLKPRPKGLFPVGRLDYNSQGLLLLTNDGKLAHRLLHPRWGVEKSYVVGIRGKMRGRDLKLIQSGVRLTDGSWVKPELHRSTNLPQGGSLVEISLREGRKREIRRMFKVLGYRVFSLQRVGFNGLKLGNLKEGRWRRLTPEEVRRLKEQVGLGEGAVDNRH